MNTSSNKYDSIKEWPLVTDKNRPKEGYIAPHRNIGCDFATMQNYTKAFQEDNYAKMKEIEENSEKKKRSQITTNIGIEINDLLMFDDLLENY